MTRMSSEFREKLEAIAEFSKRYLEKAGRAPILVGGQALDVYMLGERATQEIDMLAREDRAAGVLEEMGFTRVDRYFVRRTESSGNCSVRLRKASNTALQCPQRTLPCDSASMAAPIL